MTAETQSERLIRKLLEDVIGEDSSRPGLVETPKRVVEAWRFWCSGYRTDPASVLKAFEDGAERYDEMVVVRDIDVFSHCEHHLAPFFGTAQVAYIPNGKIVGLSKLARLVEVFSRRLQVQERLTNQIADALQTSLSPLGVGVVIKARHLCMCSRGVRHTRTETVTSALYGCMKEEGAARQEFLELVRAS